MLIRQHLFLGMLKQRSLFCSVKESRRSERSHQSQHSPCEQEISTGKYNQNAAVLAMEYFGNSVSAQFTAVGTQQMPGNHCSAKHSNIFDPTAQGKAECASSGSQGRQTLGSTCSNSSGVDRGWLSAVIISARYWDSQWSICIKQCMVCSKGRKRTERTHLATCKLFDYFDSFASTWTLHKF